MNYLTIYEHLSASGGSSILGLESCILCLESSTTVENSLQISSFMQNKPNFPDDQMNVNKVLTKDYENISNCSLAENKANTKPIQSQYKPNFKGKKHAAA